MRTREFPALAAADEPLVGQLALGLGDDAARVLAYLLCRRVESDVADEPADRLALRVGTDLSRAAVSESLDRLERRSLVSTTTVETDQGRPPTAWRAREGTDATIERVDETHAAVLLDQAVAVAADLDTPGSDDLADAVSSRPSTPASSSFTVGLNWFANALHAPLFAAQRDGAYRQRGLDVTVDTFGGSDHAIDALCEQTVDVAVSGSATITRARSADRTVVPLAPLYQRSMTVLYTTATAFGGRLDGIESVRDRRVGMPLDAETGLLGRLFLSHAGVIDDVTLVDLTGEERDALATGQVDVVSGTIGDVREREAAGETVDVLSVDGHFPVYGPTLVTTPAVCRERPAALAAFLAGTVAGWRTATVDPESAVRAVENAETDTDTDTDDRAVDTLEHAVERFGTSGDVTAHGWGWQEAVGWQRLTTALGQVGLLGDDGVAAGEGLR